MKGDETDALLQYFQSPMMRAHHQRGHGIEPLIVSFTAPNVSAANKCSFSHYISYYSTI